MRDVLAFGLMLGFLPVATSAFGQSHDAHEHGHGVLNMAIEGEQISMELLVPGADLVGFEHAPETEEQKQAVHKVLEQLRSPLQLIKLSEAANCELTDVKAAFVTLDEDHDHEDHAEHDKEDHAHDEKEDHADHDKEDHADHEDEEAHRSFRAVYAMQCTNMGALSEMAFPFFQTFPGNEELTVTVISTSAQRQFEATPEENTVSLDGLTQ